MTSGFTARAKHRQALAEGSVYQMGGASVVPSGILFSTAYPVTPLALSTSGAASTMSKFVLAARALSIPGQMMVITAFGSIGNANTNTLKAVLAINGAAVATTTSIGSSVSNFVLNAHMIIGAADQYITASFGMLGPAGTTPIASAIALTTFAISLQSATTIAFIGQSTTANAFAGDVSLWGWSAIGYGFVRN